MGEVVLDSNTTKNPLEDTVHYEVRPDIPSLYFLRRSDFYPKNLVNAYEVRNTPDTYYLEAAREIRFKIKYSPTGEIIKFEDVWMDGDYRYNDYGLPSVRYDSQKIVDLDFYYNEKNKLIKVKEFLWFDKQFLRERIYNYDADNNIKEYIMQESNAVLNNKETVKVYPNRVVSTSSQYGTIIKEFNSQHLVMKYGERDVVYSVEDNIITVQVLNADKSIYYYYVVSFDDKYRPAIPGYLTITPFSHFDDMILGRLLNYSDRNVLKIAKTERNNVGELKESYVLNYNYTYNAKGLPTEILKAKEIKNYLSNANTIYSKQLIKIGYQ
ncbi:hypothetical protein GCM10027442_31700 [Emticicia fontis]